MRPFKGSNVKRSKRNAGSCGLTPRRGDAFIHQLIRMARAFEKRKITRTPERDVAGHRRLSWQTTSSNRNLSLKIWRSARFRPSRGLKPSILGEVRVRLHSRKARIWAGVRERISPRRISAKSMRNDEGGESRFPVDEFGTPRVYFREIQFKSRSRNSPSLRS